MSDGSPTTTEALFVEGSAGPLFAVRSVPAEPARESVVLIVAPIGEEMNRSRRLMTAVRQRLAASGLEAWLVDPFGTGDSAGEFEEASWEIWIEDLIRYVETLFERSGAPVTLLGVRSGALLVDRLAATTPSRIGGRVLLQPELEGRAFMRRVMRARLLQADGLDETMDELWRGFEIGETLALGGYDFPASLALTLRSMNARDGGVGNTVHSCIEVEIMAESASAEASPSDDTPTAPEGVQAHRTVVGRPFWQLHELPPEPDVVEAVVQACIEVADGRS